MYKAVRFNGVRVSQTVHFRPVSRANKFNTPPRVRKKFSRLGPMVYRLLFESSAKLIRRIDAPTRLATDSGEYP